MHGGNARWGYTIEQKGMSDRSEADISAVDSYLSQRLLSGVQSYHGYSRTDLTYESKAMHSQMLRHFCN